eukprot:6205411-Pleurochrysis_carterae.AAC.1
MGTSKVRASQQSSLARVLWAITYAKYNNINNIFSVDAPCAHRPPWSAQMMLQKSGPIRTPKTALLSCRNLAKIRSTQDYSSRG